MSLSEKILESSEDILFADVFSNFTSFLDRIGIALTQHDIKYCNIDGRMSTGSRLKAVESFETDNMISCMLISTKAGGTGLNLIAANQKMEQI